MYLDTLYFRVAGVTFKNKDGSDRQKLIYKMPEDTSLYFIRFQYEGQPAFYICALDDNGEEYCIGTVPKDYVADVAAHYDAGHTIDASVFEKLGLDENGKRVEGLSVGVEIRVDFYDSRPDPDAKLYADCDPVDTSPDASQDAAPVAPPAPAPEKKKRTGCLLIAVAWLFIIVGFFWWPAIFIALLFILCALPVVIKNLIAYIKDKKRGKR